MNPTKEKQEFDILNVSIEQGPTAPSEQTGSKAKLIEASAGTGKTYSIGILVIRLIVEEDINIRQILMVTYTKAAVAELEGRIRQYIQEAYQHLLRGSGKVEDTIKIIMERAIKKHGQDEILKRLKRSYLNLDETAIFTIHSFCQKTLSEYAFETQQLFGVEIIASGKELIDRAVNNYWRTKISPLKTEYLENLLSYGLKKEDLHTVIQESLKQFNFVYEKDQSLDDMFARIAKEKNNIVQGEQQFINYFENDFRNSEEWDTLKKNKTLIKWFSNLENDGLAFLQLLTEKKDSKTIINNLPFLLEQTKMYQEGQEQLDILQKKTLSVLYGQAIEPCSQYVREKKEQINASTFDDLISHLHNAVYGSQGDVLKFELQKKYRAVFIDEFQDTDQQQYDIFKSLFEQSRLIFYIGDPKQAIYGFRGADIETYKKAAQNISESYTMKRNFRSSAQVIESCNAFFGSSPNVFADESIQYEQVSCGKAIAEIQKNGANSPAFSLIPFSKSEEIYPKVAQEIFDLLQSYTIEGQAVKPSDIAVLVRKGEQARILKKELDLWGIPAIQINEDKLSESKEAQEILYLLEAIADPQAESIKKALLTSFVEFSLQEIEKLDFDKIFFQFIQLKQEWLKHGVLAALNLFIRYFKVKSYLLNPELSSGQRCLANLYHLMEWVHQIENNEQLNPEELCFSYAQKINTNKTEHNTDNNAYTLRIESDEKAIQLVTIHKSKGLAYPIVISPFLNLDSNFSSKRKFITYKKEGAENYTFSMMKTENEKRLYAELNEKENRRLMYVALTRAVYKNIVFHPAKAKSDCLSELLNHLGAETKTYIERREAVDIARQRYYMETEKISDLRLIFDKKIQQNWIRSSFSKINNSHATASDKQSKTDYPTPYEQFVFSEMGRGSQLGNFIHELFENLDFTQKNFKTEIEEIGRKYPKWFRQEQLEFYQEFIDRALNCKLKRGLKLSLITPEKKIAEMEFYFGMKKELIDIINRNGNFGSIDPYFKMEGVMQGFIDLVFEAEGQFYILDWKSNHLGYGMEDYQKPELEKAMQEHNYHLQYLIYSLALHRFLKLRIPNYQYETHFGGVYYLFVRGCQKEQSTGVYYTKPSAQLIREMEQVI